MSLWDFRTAKLPRYRALLAPRWEAQENLEAVLKFRCSSANTLRISRLEFGREQLTKGPDVIRQACRQRRCVLPPSGTNRAVVCTLVQRQRLPQAHVRSGYI